MSLQAFIVDEAILSVFPTDAAGNPITTSPVWLGASIHGLRISESLTEVIDRPSGVKYGQTHHVDEEHLISIDRLWVTDVPVVTPPDNLAVLLGATDIGQPFPAQNGTDYTLRRGMRYVVPIVWQDAFDANRFHYRVYYGVTDRSHEISGSGADGEINSAINWRAEFYLK